MKASPLHGDYRYCNNCDLWHAQEELVETTVYWHDEHERVHYDNIAHKYLFNESCGDLQIWYCQHCEEAVQDEPRYLSKVWACKECGQFWETKDEGDVCCE